MAVQVGTIITLVPVLLMGKLRHGEIQKLAKNHKAYKWWRWELNLWNLELVSVNLTLNFGGHFLGWKLFSVSKNAPCVLSLTRFLFQNC